MSGEISVRPGVTISDTTPLTPALARAMMQQLVLQVLEGSITARELAAGSISADKVDADFSAQLGVPDNSITSAKIKAGAVLEAALADAIVGASKVKPGLIHDQTELPVAVAADDELLIWRSSNGQLYRVTAAALTPVGGVLQLVTAVNASVQTIASTIPFDDTKPQITEGTEILAATITPASTSSKVRVRFGFSLGRYANTNPVVTAAVFNGAADAIFAAYQNLEPTAEMFFAEYIDSPATTTAKTYSVRVASHYGSTLYLNGYYGGAPRMLGGASAATLTLEEIKG